MFFYSLIWFLIFIVCIAVSEFILKYFKQNKWGISLAFGYALLSIVAIIMIYPAREEAQMEFAFWGVGDIGFPSSRLMPFVSGKLLFPMFEYLKLDYCSNKVFSLGLSLMILGCFQYYVFGTIVQNLILKIKMIRKRT